MIKKNTAGQYIYFALVSTTDGSAVTGASVTEYVSKDGGAQAAAGGTTTERGNGQYEFAPTAGDVNCDEGGFYFTASGAIPVSISFTTETKKMADLNDLAAGALMGLANDAITSAKFDESTAFPITQADTGSSAVARVGADGDTLESLSDQIDALPSTADINAEVDTALSDIHLDHLLAVDYDPASKPGVATALFNELVENDGGVSRFTSNALEQAATGDATLANQTTIITHLTDVKGTGFVKDTDSLVDLAHIGADGDTLETLSDQIDAVPDAAAINAQVDAAIETYHLDHLFAVDYDPASKPGVATALLNEIVENDSGVSRFTTNALENAPGATGDATEAKQDTIITHLTDVKGTGFVKDTNSLVDLALASTLTTVEGKVDTIDGIVDNILVDTGTTLDGKLDSILTDTGTTLDTKIDTIDTIVDTIKDILEGDERVNTATTPWRHEIRKNTDSDWLTPLVVRELFTEAGANVTATSSIIGQRIVP